MSEFLKRGHIFRFPVSYYYFIKIFNFNEIF